MRTRKPGVWILTALLAWVAGSVPPRFVQSAATQPPNIVFILADDLGWRDTRVYGSTFYETPHLDRLARRGMVFTNAYAANPLCSPTRASILTGQYPCRLRITVPSGHIREELLDPVVLKQGPPTQKAVVPQSRNRLLLEHYTLAEALKDAGYATAHFGKWHLGWEPYHAQAQGFDFVFPGGSYPGPPGSYFAPFRAPIIKDAQPGEHIEERTAAEAVKWLRANYHKPFFLNYWLFSVHSPWTGKPELIEKYRGKADPSRPQRNPVMGAMVETLDACVGRVLDALEELKVADNTLIIFSSDNGGVSWRDLEETPGAPVTSNLPLRNGKASIYEGGTRVPLIVVWHGQVKPGSRSDAMVSSIDYYPTLLEAVGIKPRPDQVIDGISVLPALKDGALQRDTLFCHFPHDTPASGNLPSTWVRQGDWKLIRFYADGPGQEDRFELYNLRNDIGETKNLADAMPEKVTELNALIMQHLKDTSALVPIPNPAYRQAIAGWHGNQHAALSLQEGTLVVRSTGGDPFLTTRDVPSAKGPFTLELRMKSDSKGNAQVFWTTARERNFHRDRSVTFAVMHDGGWHAYRIKLPVETAITALRLDPSTAPGEVQIEWLRLRNRADETVKEWRPDKE